MAAPRAQQQTQTSTGYSPAHKIHRNSTGSVDPRNKWALLELEKLDPAHLDDRSPPTPSIVRQKSAPPKLDEDNSPIIMPLAHLHPVPILHSTGTGTTAKETNASKKDVPMWTVEEDLLILKLVEMYGKKWSKIASYLPGRTDNGVRNRWNRMEKAQTLRKNRGLHHGYRCRRCGQPKRGHICAALTSGDQPEGIDLASRAAELSEISASKMSAIMESTQSSSKNLSNKPPTDLLSKVERLADANAVLENLSSSNPTSHLGKFDDFLSELNESLSLPSPRSGVDFTKTAQGNADDASAATEWTNFMQIGGCQESPRSAAANADLLIESVFSTGTTQEDDSSTIITRERMPLTKPRVTKLVSIDTALSTAIPKLHVD